ncbi:MAG: hypothetical protein IH623_13985 [Verrucomicrobia bacterium]|nr:hypothetical protein [Verrucomicrobiota bacterium]
MTDKPFDYDLDGAVVMLLVQYLEGDTDEELFDFMQARHDARLDDREWPPKYRIGPTGICKGMRFAQIQTYAGSLILHVIRDAQDGRFGRPIIYRSSSTGPFTLLNRDGVESELEADELIKSKT